MLQKCQILLIVVSTVADGVLLVIIWIFVVPFLFSRWKNGNVMPFGTMDCICKFWSVLFSWGQVRVQSIEGHGSTSLVGGYLRDPALSVVKY